MRNTEYTALVLSKLREGKNEKQIALETQRHRNTVSRHVNWLRNNFQTEPQLLTNEVLQRLKERINDMTDRDLVRFLSVLMPQKIESKQQVEISEETVTVNVTENEDEILSKAASILARKDKSQEIHGETRL